MICGGTYPDHLELWWSKHLYSPFDRYLDKTYNDALVLSTDGSDGSGTASANPSGRRNNKVGTTNKGGSKGSSSAQVVVVDNPPSYAFHRRYVHDVSHIVRDVHNPQERKELIRKNLISNRKQMNFDSRHDDPEQKYARLQLHQNPDADVSYVVAIPAAAAAAKADTDADTGNGGKRSIKDAIIDLVTSITLGSIDDMIYVQGIENRSLKKYKGPRDRL